MVQRGFQRANALYGRYDESKHKAPLLQSFAYRMQAPFEAYSKEDPTSLKFVGATFHLRLLCKEITRHWYNLCELYNWEIRLDAFDPPNEERKVIKEVLRRSSTYPVLKWKT